ncbi:hypothetical protein MKZ38_005484 [Zalerion maritima]|uniref:Uncharacterized protein n=1 Tax=Zalerion maritima TaxID=339359 RepID=A0AAD5RKD0_9PEZI|nr:hypothetical protein MKZ38_005484 [Zalerion maritima]
MNFSRKFRSAICAQGLSRRDGAMEFADEHPKPRVVGYDLRYFDSRFPVPAKAAGSSVKDLSDHTGKTLPPCSLQLSSQFGGRVANIVPSNHGANPVNSMASLYFSISPLDSVVLALSQWRPASSADTRYIKLGRVPQGIRLPYSSCVCSPPIHRSLILHYNMAHETPAAEIVWAAVTWLVVIILHLVQAHLVPKKRTLLCACAAFVVSGTAFLLPSLLSARAQTKFPLFVAFEVVCITHLMLVQYITTLYPLASTQLISGPWTYYIQLGVLTLIAIFVGAGLPVLLLFEIPVIWGMPLVLHVQCMGTFLYYASNFAKKLNNTRSANGQRGAGKWNPKWIKISLWVLFATAILLCSLVWFFGGLFARNMAVFKYPALAQNVFSLIKSMAAVLRNVWKSWGGDIQLRWRKKAMWLKAKLKLDRSGLDRNSSVTELCPAVPESV